MRTKLFIVVSLVMVVSMVLAACAPAATPSAPQVVTQVVTVEVPVEGAPGETIIVTATPEPVVAKEFKSADPTTYINVTFADPETLDPAAVYESAGGAIVQNVYESLIWFNKDNPIEFIPQLATEVPSLENGGISADGLTYTFNIRPGVKFHDGTEMTPEDVAFSFQRGMLLGGTSGPQWLLTEPILGAGIYDITDIITPTLAGPEVETLNDDPASLILVPPEELLAACQKVTDAIVADPAAGTVTFKLAQPWAPFIPTLSMTWGSILSKAWVAANGGWDGDCATWQNFYGKTTDELNALPLGSDENGTGPYVLESWTPGEELVMAAFEDYWRTEPAWEGGPSGAPKLKRVLIKNVSEFSTRYAMIQAGDADEIAAGSSANWPQMDELTGQICERTDDNCQPTGTPDQPLEMLHGYQAGTRTDLFMTWVINAEGNTFIGSGQLDGNGIPADFFSDEHVRKGIAYCFNYEQYLQDVLLGEGTRSNNVMLPGEIGYQDDFPVYTYDPAKCEEEFKASPWSSADGKSLWDTGFRFTFAYNTGNTTRQTMGQILQSELAAVNENFIVEVTGLPWPTFLRNQRARNLPMFSVGWIEDIHDPHNWVQPYAIGTYGSRAGLPQELKDQFAEIIDRGVAETDPDARAEIYHEFNQLFYDQIPAILLYVLNQRAYQQRWVQGWYPNPMLYGNYYYAMWKE